MKIKKTSRSHIKGWIFMMKMITKKKRRRKKKDTSKERAAKKFPSSNYGRSTLETLLSAAPSPALRF
jgi:hypothetical protein